MENKNIYIYLKNEILVNIFSELNQVIEKKFNLNFEIIDDLSKLQERCCLICDNVSFRELPENTKIDINYYLIDFENFKDNVLEKIYNITIFKSPIKISDFLTYIQNEQISAENKIKNIIKFGFFSYDKENRRIFNTHKNLKFTEKENEIFFFLLETSKNNKSVTKKMMLENVWNYNAEIDTHTLETHIYLIRRKIEDKLNIADAILYEDGIGYRLVTENF